MGVSGKGLRADGLHKSYMNGSQADHNGSTEKMRTGAQTNNVPRNTQTAKSYLDGLPREASPIMGRGVAGNGLQSVNATVKPHSGGAGVNKPIIISTKA